MRKAAAILIAVGVFAGCTGDDDAADPTTVPAVSSSVPTTAASSTTAAATTTAPPTTAAATTTLTTDPPPTTTETTPTTTTLDPISDLAAALARDAQAGDDVLFEVLAAPSAVDAEDRLAQVFSGDALRIALDLLEEYRAGDLVVVAHPTVKRVFVLAGEPDLTGENDGAQVTVETCRLDSDIVMAPLVGSDERVPINITIYRTEAVSTFRLADGFWQLDSWQSTLDETGDKPCV